MEVLAKRQQFSTKSTKKALVSYIVISIILIIVGVVLVLIKSDYLKYISIILFILGGLLLLLGISYGFRSKSVVSGRSDYVLYDEASGQLELYPYKMDKVTQNIKNLTNVSSQLARSRYQVYSYGRLILEFGKDKYLFIFVSDLHETSTKILICKEKFHPITK